MPQISDLQAQEEAERQREASVLQTLESQTRLNGVAFRVMSAGSEFCGEKVTWRNGYVATTTAKVAEEFRPAYYKLYGVDDTPTVVMVYGGAAREAGLQVTDKILSINGKALTKGGEMDEIHSALDEGKEQPFTMRVRRGEDFHDLTMNPEKVCSYPVTLQTNDQVNAFADGSQVYITTGMMRFVQSDDELALIVGHETAHNTMKHSRAQLGNRILGALIGATITVLTGVNVAGSMANAAQFAYSQEFEAEADYVGSYYAARAGYNVSGAAELWRRMASAHPNAINLQGSTHPSTAKRFLAVNKAVEEIDQKRSGGRDLKPELKE